MTNPLALKPCPFCGGKASYENVPLGRYMAVDDHRWGVGCRDEECIGFQWMKTFPRKKDAAAAWNRRSDAALQAVYKLAAELCDSIDAEDIDVGGHRPSRVILGELGQAVDEVSPR